jgi:hypothetical protein
MAAGQKSEVIVQTGAFSDDTHRLAYQHPPP